MHSSRMRTVHGAEVICPMGGGGAWGCLPRGVSAQGVSAQGVSARGGLSARGGFLADLPRGQNDRQV